MLTEKTLSIIIPSYNMEAYLPQCLDSLLGPDVPVELLDIIVVNDGSRDRTSEIAHSYADRYPESIRVIDKANGNYGSCINAALPTARGRYVKILDADDSFSPDTFPAYVRFLTTATANLVLNAYATVAPEGKTIATTKFNIAVGHISTPEEFADALESPFQLAMHAVAYRTELIKNFDYRQTEGVSYSDTEWVVVPLLRVTSVEYFNKGVIYRYLVGRNGQTTDNKAFQRNVAQLIPVMKNITTRLTEVTPQSVTTNLWNYLMDYCLCRYKMIYTAILDWGDSNRHASLMDFDKWLQTQPDIPCISQLETMQSQVIPGCRFKIVNYWRNHKRKQSAPLLRLRRFILHITEK